MTFRNRKKKILLLSMAVILGLQALQPKRNQGEAMGVNDIAKVLPVPDTVQVILKRACFDCHSNRTSYPWYSAISPVNWWLAFHIGEGKQEVNFSTFGDYSTHRQAETLQAIAEAVKNGGMPLSSYLLMHKEARLSAAEKRLLVNWANEVQKNLKKPGSKLIP
jgi:hypothetical protein